MNKKNIAASVRARLYNQAKKDKRPVDELVQYFALERFLYRFSVSAHKDLFVLKGALMLRAWNAPNMRPTKDIDLLGTTDNGIEHLEMIVRDICNVSVEDDGMCFNADTVAGVLIKEKSTYTGVRVTFKGKLENAEIKMQIDVGFGDTVYPEIKENDYPTLLEFDAPRIKMYPLDTVVAEKFQTMVQLTTFNSRMKDFYDVYLLLRQFEFDTQTLTTAIRRTFETRNTPLTSNPTVFDDSFAKDPNIVRQWRAFLKKGMKGTAPDDIGEVIAQIKLFLQPVLESIQ